MQTKFTLLLAAVALFFGTTSAIQFRQSAVRNAQIESLQRETAEAAQKLETEEATVRKLEKQKASLTRQVQELATAKAPEVPVATAPTPVRTKGAGKPGEAGSSPAVEAREGMGSMLSKMMDNPQMREMIKGQQKVAMQMIYGPMLSEMNLAPDVKEKLNEMLLENQMKNIERGTALMKDGVDKVAAGKVLADQKLEFDGQVRSLLGDAQFAQYEDYNKSIPDRMAMTQLKTQLTGDNALSDQQNQFLLQVMREERLSVMGDKPKVDDWKAISSADGMDKFFSQQEELNARVLQRAQSILTPEQYQSFASFQTNQLSMQKMSVKMAQTMFKSDKAEAPAPPVPAGK